MQPTTHLYTVVLCSATILLHGVTCHRFPQAVDLVTRLSMEGSKQYKRQADAGKMAQQQCVLEKYDAVYQGNNSRFVSECRSAITISNDLASSDRDNFGLPSNFTALYRIFCIPECGDVLIDAYNDCGVFDGPEDEEYAVALCGANQNGDFCYEIFTDNVNLFLTSLSCYRNYTVATSRRCDCQSELAEGVAEQGCCIDALHDFVNTLDLSGYMAEDVYDVCNVNLPVEGCNNSPLRTSSSLGLPHFSYVFVVAVTILMVNAVQC